MDIPPELLRASCSTALDILFKLGLPKFGEFVMLFIWASGPPPDCPNIPLDGLIEPRVCVIRGPTELAAAIIAA